MLPGWYGLGRGLAAATETHGEGLLQEMASQWHFFRTMLSDVETAIAKSDLDIAARYSALAGDLHGHFFPRIATEFAHTRDMILRVLRQQSLLESNRTLRRSIRLRNPYVDPMSLLQVELLRRWRESGDASLLATLIGSINGIARGLQDAG
jgi:phosphoenolpyruvate carboxylase